MTVITPFDGLESVEKGLAICLGFFDGIHVGHIEVIKEAFKHSDRVAVLTFESQIKVDSVTKLLRPLLTTLEDRAEILSQLGVKYLIPIEFPTIKNLNPSDFLHLLCEKFKPKYLVCGHDFRFGKEAVGTIDTLLHFERQFGYRAVIVDLISICNRKISSSGISELILQGDMTAVTEELGRFYSIRGEVVHGLANGRRLGYKTANLKLSFPYVIPPDGVYATIATLEGVSYLSMTNIGVHPTLNALAKSTVETHIFDFDGEIYGRIIKLEFLDLVRRERKFKSIGSLKAQLSEDERAIRSKYKNRFRIIDGNGSDQI